MKKKKGILLTVIGLVGLIAITVATTYAFFNYAKEGTTDNTITTSTITFLYTEIDKVGAGISIKDAYPISDTQGKMLSGTNEVFDFKITSTTPNTSSIPYEITARKNSDSTLDEEAVKLYLTKVTGTSEEEVLLSKYSDLTQTSKVTSDKYTEKTIYTGKVPANSESYEQAFKLRMWISSDTNFSPDENDNYPYNDKEFSITVNVYANAKVVTEEEILDASKAEISSLSINGEELTKVENQDYDYEVSLPEGTTSTSLDVETEGEYATVKIERIDSLAYSSNIKRLSTKKILDLNPGNNYFKITVTSEDGKEIKEYKIKIKVKEVAVLLSQTIFNQYSTIYDNPTLDKTNVEAGDPSGLYVSTATNDNQPTYYFRGNVENYIDFAGLTWRVVRINEDGTIRLIMQDGINDNDDYKFNPSYRGYTYMYYSNSNIENGAMKTLEEWYQDNIVEKGYSQKVVIGEYFCEQARVKYTTSDTGGNVNMPVYSNYTPDFTCEKDSKDENDKGKVSGSIGLITYDEVIHAGGYPYISNSDYYLYNDSINWWTMSTSGVSSGNGAYIWRVLSTGDLSRHIVNYTSEFRPVINLKANTTVTGTGKSDDHWVVQ